MKKKNFSYQAAIVFAIAAGITIRLLPVIFSREKEVAFVAGLALPIGALCAGWIAGRLWPQKSARDPSLLIAGPAVGALIALATVAVSAPIVSVVAILLTIDHVLADLPGTILVIGAVAGAGLLMGCIPAVAGGLTAGMLLSVWQLSRGKPSRSAPGNPSARLIVQANAALLNKQYADALRLYTEAEQFAPLDEQAERWKRKAHAELERRPPADR